MDTLQLAIHNGIATVTLNRPEKRNALNSQLLTELRSTFEELGANPEVRVIILEANGKAFCAGADLGYLQQVSQFSVMENLADSTHLQQTFHTIYTCPKPTIAKVHGAAIAGGCGLATVCDFVIAGRTKALFGYSEVKIGFIPAVVSVYLLRKIGDTQTRRLLLSAENISAEEAERIGLITHAVDDDQLTDKVQSVAETLSNNSSSSVALTKKMLENLHGMDLDAGLRYAASMNAITRMTDDCKNGIQSFLQQ
ncbi:MAG: enoyl-CoA hydratase/isomerase family protein [Candidatus Kapabacteria bacterium]|nr:enoyl-CoA hydratase/isomerase family protein [Candidatus Kapabacteria bacterium]MBX7153543.1 enoyl-CoA hydratase/isomerase family protein [Bacteroidota bacterium]